MEFGSKIEFLWPRTQSYDRTGLDCTLNNAWKTTQENAFSSKRYFQGVGDYFGTYLHSCRLGPLPRVIYKCIVLCCLHFFFTKFTYSAMKTDMAFSCLAEPHLWIQKIVSPFLDCVRNLTPTCPLPFLPIVRVSRVKMAGVSICPVHVHCQPRLLPRFPQNKDLIFDKNTQKKNLCIFCKWKTYYNTWVNIVGVILSCSYCCWNQHWWKQSK